MTNRTFSSPKQLLKIKPSERMSLKEAREHPWIKTFVNKKFDMHLV